MDSSAAITRNAFNRLTFGGVQQTTKSMHTSRIEAANQPFQFRVSMVGERLLSLFTRRLNKPDVAIRIADEVK